ncbi:hypothetical protein FOL75_12105 [Bacillus thuringiensis]|uniref:glutaredoxin family protein n=1 Tax=Bacillus thuringiensis TaxID=1428 RepID=UPI002853D96F|nr:glutaredoxin domain-containing protein [Bacillus thuringiensis]MDR5022687.1 hypothetical protein [Bacillus thuringiensis]
MTKPVKVKMFTKMVCPTCKVAKQQLSFLPVDVDIEEINIETDSVHVGGRLMDADVYLTDILESMATPTFEFESGRIVRGFEMGEIMEELGL